MGSLNRVELIGNIGREPEFKDMDDGSRSAKFSLATTEPAYTLANGKQIPEKTEWHNIVAYGAMAKVVEKYLRKGHQVYIDGKMRTRSYDDRGGGAKRYVVEIWCNNIVLLNQKAANNAPVEESAPAPDNYATQPPVAQQQQQTQQEQGGYSDDLPF